jgi:hypothetical protein
MPNEAQSPVLERPKIEKSNAGRDKMRVLPITTPRSAACKEDRDA